MLIGLFLVWWVIVCVRGYDFATPQLVNSINRLELNFLKRNMIIRLVAVGSVAITCFMLFTASIFIEGVNINYVFNPIRLAYNDLIHFCLLFIALFTFGVNSIYQKALTQLIYQKANPSLNTVEKVKLFNFLFNAGVMLFALCLDIQLIYRALSSNIM